MDVALPRIRRVPHSCHCSWPPPHCVRLSLWGSHGLFNWPLRQTFVFINSKRDKSLCTRTAIPRSMSGSKGKCICTEAHYCQIAFRETYQFLFLVSVLCILPTLCVDKLLDFSPSNRQDYNTQFHLKPDVKFSLPKWGKILPEFWSWIFSKFWEKIIS